MSGTSVYSSIMYYEMGPKCLPGIAILAFVAYSWRDAVLDEGSRGLGKRYMGLEIVKEKDGTLPGRYETVGRSFYFISYYGLLALGNEKFFFFFLFFYFFFSSYLFYFVLIFIQFTFFFSLSITFFDTFFVIFFLFFLFFPHRCV